MREMLSGNMLSVCVELTELGLVTIVCIGDGPAMRQTQRIRRTIALIVVTVKGVLICQCVSLCQIFSRRR